MDPNQDVKYTKLFINDRFVDAKSGKTYNIYNPATGKVLAKIAEGNRLDVDLAVDVARRAMLRDSKWRLLDASVRGQLLFRLADLIERDQNILANLETLNTGKTWLDAVRDVNLAVDTFRFYGGYADKIYGQTIQSNDSDLLSYTRKEPIGVVGLIASWDQPIVVFARKVAPVLAAGSTVIYKPSSKTPLTALYIAQLMQEVGIPEGVVNVITGYGHVVGEAIGLHDDIRHITFTGRTDIGRKYLEYAAKSNLKKVALHLGGKNPLIVLNDSDIDDAVLIAHHAVFFNQGQTALAAGRIYVHDDIYDTFVKRSVDLARKRIVGNPFDKDVRHGALIDEFNYNRFVNFVELAKREGAKLEFGGNRVGTTGWFVEPTVFTNVTDDMRIAKEELLGPIQIIMRFKNPEEILDRANRTKFGLAAGVITKDLHNALYLTRRLNTGLVWVNTWHEIVPQATIGGIRESGWGRYMGQDAIDQYLETKTINGLLQTKTFDKYRN